MTNTSFQPLWASPPGDTITDILLDKSLSNQQFAKLLDFPELKVEKLLSGKITISTKLAEKLEEILGSTRSYWLNRESQYRDDLLHFKSELDERKEWIKKIPVGDMIKSGWINPSNNKEMECLQFFGITKASQWYDKYNDMLAITAFKTSASYDSEPESVVTWLRKSEISSEKIISGPWDADKFRKAIQEARKLSRIKDPQKYLPKLQQLFAPCGVAILIEKAPTRCRASGAAYFTTPTKAIILLSGRYLSDDHFWFCLFHEAAHLLLHGNKSLFLEFEDNSKHIDVDSINEEHEADSFAEKVLIPEEHKDEFMTLNAKKWKQIVRFAKKIDISAGIVVGQLQHLNKVDHRYLNKMKNRYKWKDGALVEA